jgi:virginiamycin B lyase
MPDPAARDPHSLAFDQNGILFFTVQDGNFIGRLDPTSGKVTLKAVPTAGAKPYCMIIAPDATPWFCEFGSNKMGRIDPATLAITEVTLPEGARPRRATFGKDGDIYYSDYARGFIGHLHIKDGKVEEFASPGGRLSRPYGIATTPDGMIWYSESGVQPNTVVRFDPQTHDFQKWPIPSGGGVVRNLVATPDGRLYLACSGVNKVAVVDIK